MRRTYYWVKTDVFDDLVFMIDEHQVEYDSAGPDDVMIASAVAYLELILPFKREMTPVDPLDFPEYFL